MSNNRIEYVPDVNRDRLNQVIDAVASRFNGLTIDGCMGEQEIDGKAVAATVVYKVLREYRPDLFVDRPGEGKYKTPEALADVLKPGEPWFVLLARDVHSVSTLLDYALRVEGSAGRDSPFSVDLKQGVIPRFLAWRYANPLLVKLPT